MLAPEPLQAAMILGLIQSSSDRQFGVSSVLFEVGHDHGHQATAARPATRQPDALRPIPILVSGTMAHLCAIMVAVSEVSRAQWGSVSDPDLGGADVEGGYVVKIEKGARITGTTLEEMTVELVRKYDNGASIRQLAEDTGRSYGFVHQLLGRRRCHPARPRRRHPAQG